MVWSIGGRCRVRKAIERQNTSRSLASGILCHATAASLHKYTHGDSTYMRYAWVVQTRKAGLARGAGGRWLVVLRPGAGGGCGR